MNDRKQCARMATVEALQDVAILGLIALAIVFAICAFMLVVFAFLRHWYLGVAATTLAIYVWCWIASYRRRRNPPTPDFW